MGSSELQFSKLLITVVDNRGKTCPIEKSGIPLIATNCVRNDLLYPTYEKARFVSREIYDTWFRGHPAPGDILFVNKATPGRVCLVPDPVNFCIAQDMVAVRADPNAIYPLYLFAVLRSPLVQDRIAQMHVGSLIPHFKKGDFDKLLIPIPDRSIQEFIGDTYFNLSAKIEINRQQNETLEAMARTLFKAWFVDFEPVRAKMEGRWQRGQSLPGLPAHLYDLFPDRLMESELGEIPEGWRISRVSDYLSLTYGKALPAMSRNDGNVPVYGSGGVTGFHDVALVDHETVIVGRKGTVGSLYWEQRPSFPIDTVFFVQPLVSMTFCYHLLESLPLRDMNTDAAVPGLNRENVYRLEVCSPPHRLIDNFSQFARNLRDQIFELENESRTLAQLRDTLLPKLISGELRILDAEKNVKGVRA